MYYLLLIFIPFLYILYKLFGFGRSNTETNQISNDNENTIQEIIIDKKEIEKTSQLSNNGVNVHLENEEDILNNYEVKYKRNLYEIFSIKEEWFLLKTFSNDEYSNENIEFFEKIEELSLEKDEEKRKDLKKNIYETFVQENSKKQLNLNDKIKKNLESGYLNSNIDFTSAKNEINNFMNQILNRFFESIIWKRYCKTNEKRLQEEHENKILQKDGNIKLNKKNMKD
jgi:hypothetical protein